MLVCPNCQFENPNTNKFCQECGTSLTQNICPECDSMVSFDALHCQECGAVAGVIWWAILLETQGRSGAASPSERARSTSANSGTAAGVQSSTDAYLDFQQRYQLLEFLPPVSAANPERQVRVLDCQPFQLSLLEALAQKAGEFSSPESAQPDATAGNAEANAAGISSIQALAVPAIAQPYIALRSSLFQAVPAIHDAWQQDGQQIILLEDRSEFPLLIDLWRDEDTNLPPLQILHWLYEMVELWDALDPWRCQQSLLELANLRVDEDQSFCLQRLYSDTATPPLKLQDLGQIWQTLFAESQRTHFGAMSLLLADLDAGNIRSTDELRSRIEAIAHELQPSPTPAEIPFGPVGNEGIELPVTQPPSEFNSGRSDSRFRTAASAPTRIEAPEAVAAPEEENEGDSDPTVVLPMQLFNLEDVGRTDIGRQRQHNEDYFGIETQVAKLESPSGKTVHVRNLYILCDGMGGQADGEVASAMAVDTLRRYFKEKWQSAPFSEGMPNLPGPDAMNEAVQLANKAIYDVNQQNARSGSGRMGTTLVLVLVQDTEVAIAHVGDSRLYRYTRKRGLEQITVDHEVGQREIQRGVDPELAYARPDAYQLTQALGPRDEHFVKPDIQYLELNEDSLLLLCSDGLTDNDLLETHCRSHVEPLLSSQTNLEQGVNQLIELANKYNGHDNISAIAIRAKVRPNLTHLR